MALSNFSGKVAFVTGAASKRGIAINVYGGKQMS
jgi:hypothetical protein